jgi:hypothetical protein
MQRVGAGSLRSFFALALLAAAACSPSGRNGDETDGGGVPPGPDARPGDPDSGMPQNGPPYPDFPAAPILDMGVPANAADLFSVDDQLGSGPCLAEPEIGTLFPNGWLRPRFTLVGSGSQNFFEIRITADDETNPLVVYTTKTQWTMPSDIWAKMSLHLPGRPITVQIRGAVLQGAAITQGPMLGTVGTVQIAPAAATGTIVYWTTSDGSNPNGSALKAFDIGNESVHLVLRPKNAALNETQGCIGCHVTTPDGKYLAFADAVDPNITPGNLIDGRPGYIDIRSPIGDSPDAVTDRPPADELSPTAITLLSRKNQHAPTFSAAHWETGNRYALTMFQPNAGGVYTGKTEIIWTDLETMTDVQGMGWDVLARVGDTNSAAAAAFSHDGTKVAYVSGSSVDSGVRDSFGKIFTVPFNNRLGGQVAEVAGANDPNKNQSYPSWSADDRLIGFTRTNFTGAPHSYDNASAEIFVIPSEGGAATRIRANDPPTCGGSSTSPGVTNSWAKWSPGPVSTIDGKTYYWLAFSSRRGANHLPQIYVAPIVYGETGIETYPAIYLWNQPANEANHTPAWDNLQIQ